MNEENANNTSENETFADLLANSFAENLKIEQRPGKRYIKLVCSHYNKRTGERAHSSVWCFIDKESGAVYKPASFKAPAKHVRFNLLLISDREWLMENADWAGGYLYMK